jgi:mannosyl-oligosaccharide alpha-1,2-mannosidase
MEGLLSLTRKISPSNFYYVCEKNGVLLSEKVKSSHGANY